MSFVCLSIVSVIVFHTFLVEKSEFVMSHGKRDLMEHNGHFEQTSFSCTVLVTEYIGVVKIVSILKKNYAGFKFR